MLMIRLCNSFKGASENELEIISAHELQKLIVSLNVQF